MVCTEVVASPRGVSGSAEKIAVWRCPLQLVEETEEEGKPVSRIKTRSSFPCYNPIYLLVATGLGGREKL